MKIALLVLAIAGFAVTAEAADAPKATCIDPSRDYVSRALNNHEIYLESTIGPKKPPQRITTSCHHLGSAISFGFSSSFHCVDQGDTVVPTILGESQTCRVTKVAPYVPQKDDLPMK